jgi:hypothetical protein
MVTPVVDHVHQAVARLPWRLDEQGVIAVREHAAATALRPGLADRHVQALGSGDLETLHALREGFPVCRFDEQMDVVGLDADVHDAEVLAARCNEERVAQRSVGLVLAQPADRRRNP